MSLPRVLLITHNVISQNNNMGKTLAGLFENWDSDCLFQLYFHSDAPNMNIAGKYYKFTDVDALKSIFSSKNKGTLFLAEDLSDKNSEISDFERNENSFSKAYSYGHKHKGSMQYFLRNTVWSLSRWCSDKLIKQISDFKPDIILFACGDYAFSYKIVYKLSCIFNIPATMICYDDYYINHEKKPFSFLYNYTYNNLMKWAKKVSSRSDAMLTICNSMSRDYSKLFGIKCYEMYTPSSEFENYNSEEKHGFSYMGNLGINRYKSLIKLGQAVKKVTGELINVYSAEDDDKIISQMTEENGLRFLGKVSSEEVKEIMQKSLFVIHTEAFDRQSINRVRYSVSTKIADSLNCGTCILAYGSKEVASIDYLITTESACVITEDDNIEDKILQIFNSEEMRNRYIKNAKELSEKNHNSKINHEKLSRILQGSADRFNKNSDKSVIL